MCRHPLGSILILFLLLSGCRPTDSDRPQSLVLHIKFDDAAGIGRGRVMASGIKVGDIMGSPRFDREGTGVIVSVLINQFPADRLQLLNDQMTAIIETSQLMIGEKQIALHFCDHPGEALADGAVIQGVNNLIELKAWQLTCGRGTPSVNRVAGALFIMDPALTGYGAYYLNLATFIVGLVLAAIMAIDILRKLLLARSRSPRLFILFWRLFILCATAKLLILGIGLASGMGLLPIDWLEPLLRFPDRPLDLLRWDAKFLGLLALFLGIKFRFGLLSAVLPQAVLRKEDDA